jgi:hypothetical protein
MSSESRQPTEEELRAAYEDEVRRVRVEHVLLDNVAAIANLGMRRTGLAPGTEAERDPAQVRLAIESIRALLPVLEQVSPGQMGAIREAVSQLQLAYVKIGGAEGDVGAPPSTEPSAGAASAASTPPPVPEAPSPAPEGPPPKPGEPGPAQRSGRLWVPGQ